MLAPLGQAPDSAVVLLTSATFPDVAPMAKVPVASGVGSGVVPPASVAELVGTRWRKAHQLREAHQA